MRAFCTALDTEMSGAGGAVDLCCHPIFLFGSTHHDLECVVWRRRCKGFASSHGPRIQTSRSSSVVKMTGKTIDLMWPRHWLRLRAAITVGRCPDAPESEQTAVLIEGKQTTSFFLVPGFGSGAYSAKLLAGTRQRCSGLNQMRQWGEVVLRMLVTGGPPARSGGGIP